jgi:hypothetical protein
MSNRQLALALAALSGDDFGPDVESAFDEYRAARQPRHYLGADVEILGADALDLLGNDAANVASLLGADGVEILGQDLLGEDLLGAARKRVVRRQPRVMKELFLPLPSTAILNASPTAIINVQPQLTCQINQLVIPSNVGNLYMVNDVLIGTRSQFAAPGAISGVALSEVQTGQLKGDTATLGTIISVSITNVSGVDQTLTGAFFRVLALVS